MKIFLLAYLILVTSIVTTSASGQTQLREIDSLRTRMLTNGDDTSTMVTLLQMASAFAEIDPDSSYYFASKVIPLAEKMHFQLELASGLHEMGYAMNNIGNYSRALQLFLDAINILEDPASERHILPNRFPPSDEFSKRNTSAHIQRMNRMSRVFQYLGILYINSGNAEKSLDYIQRSITIAKGTSNLQLLAITFATRARLQFQGKQIDAAIASLDSGYHFAREAAYERYYGTFLLNLGRAYAEKKDYTQAVAYYHEALDQSIKNGYYRGIVASRLLLADYNSKNDNLDSMLFQSRAALETSRSLNSPDLLIRSYRSLSNYYNQTHAPDSVVKYQGLILRISDSLNSSKQLQQFQNIDFNEQQKRKDIAIAQKDYKNKVQRGILVASVIGLLTIALFIWRTSRQRQLLNEQLIRQKKDLETAIQNLKKAEKKLIHAEKMASLGALTAGIAHEIQNPLNFVNNFSELNMELADELSESLQRGDFQDLEHLVSSIRTNQGKVLEHGKRAESIVKLMLLHSRTGSSEKTSTNLNALVEETIRISYQGFKTREMNFNASFSLQLDPELPTVNLVEQDLRKVILNICNNAFYAVDLKYKRIGEPFEPNVILSTKYTNGEVKVVVEDNGEGIPDDLKEKIFQPFFTTKPTGEGTGLGLSLSYDMIKAEGGDISVHSSENGPTVFTITLPAT